MFHGSVPPRLRPGLGNDCWTLGDGPHQPRCRVDTGFRDGSASGGGSVASVLVAGGALPRGLEGMRGLAWAKPPRGRGHPHGRHPVTADGARSELWGLPAGLKGAGRWEGAPREGSAGPRAHGASGGAMGTVTQPPAPRDAVWLHWVLPVDGVSDLGQPRWSDPVSGLPAQGPVLLVHRRTEPDSDPPPAGAASSEWPCGPQETEGDRPGGGR